MTSREAFEGPTFEESLAMEQEHFGCIEAGTGIYAPRKKKTMADYQAALDALLAQRQQLTIERDGLAAAREHLPRHDKKGAREMMLEINALTKRLTSIKKQIALVNVDIGRVDSHGLWHDAVKAVCGDEALRACMQHMADARRARRAEQRADAIKEALK